MDLYEHISESLSRLAPVPDWPDMQRLIRRAVAPRPPHWQLPLLSCQAAGGAKEQAFEAALAIACLQMGIMLVDDLLDEDPRGEHVQIGAPAAANLACAFQALGLGIIATSPAPAHARLQVIESLNQMMLDTAHGQQMDIQNPQGEMIQIHDDLGDTMATPASPDWMTGRTTLPILFAQSVVHAERERFLELRQQASDPVCLVEAQAILLRCGAVSYCIDQLLQRYRQARKLVESLPISERSGLEHLLAEQERPVEELFRALAVDVAALML
ncbi:MAG: polyprenyl synthetase family protein [Chloroflexota bacterium]